NKIIATEKFVTTNYVMVAGLGVGDISEIVLRDRQILAQDGIFIIIAPIDKHTGLLIKEAEVVSRGFVYMKESRDLINETKKQIQNIISHSAKEQIFNDVYL
ncbi:MAG: RNase J family beta-CASP ribonuclease, partial [Caldisericia bacterium]|nr:RNase J family beta-CASP ribonuclease [Caldisericia bacterium]